MNAKKLLSLLILLLGCSLTASAQQTYNWTAASGSDLLWATPANWTPSGPPGPADTAWFNNNALVSGAGTAFTDNILAASRTIRFLLYSNNTIGFSHNTLLNPGVTLIVSNNIAGDYNLVVGATPNLAGPVTNTISGTGATLIVTNPVGNITIRSASGGNTLQNSVFDLSGLDTFNAGMARFFVGADAVLNREVGTFYLAKTNLIILSGAAPQLDIGDNPANGVGSGNSPSNQLSVLYLGQTNALFADTITVGKSKCAGMLAFNPTFVGINAPTLYLRGKSTTRVSALAVGDDSGQTTSNQQEMGIVDFTGGIVDALVDVNYVGRGPAGTGNSAGTATGLMTIGAGNYDVNTLEVAYQSNAGSASPETGTVNLNGGTLVVNTVLELAHYSGTGGACQGTLNVSNGIVTVKGSITSGGGTSAINFNNGILNAGFAAAVVGKPAAPIGSLSFSNTVLNLAPSFFATNIVATTLNAFSGTANTINISIMPAITSYPAQVPLIQYAAPSGDLSTFVLGTMPASTPPFQGYLTNDTTISQIYLVLTNGEIGTPPPAPKADVWNGVPSGNWDTTTLNWTSSGSPASYADITSAGVGDNVTFDDTATGTTTVNLTTTVSPGSVTFNNTTKNYTLAGTGKISGATGLTMQGGGTLTLTESGGDNFSGGLTVGSGTVIIDNNSGGIVGTTINSGGTLQLGNNDGNGAFPSGLFTDNGTLIFNRSDNSLNVATVITGSGSLINNGTGTVTLTGVEPLTGAVVVNAGTLAAAGPNSNPSTLSASSSITINTNATVLVTGDNSLTGSTGTTPIFVNAGGTLTGTASRSSHIHGPLTLNGGNLAMQGTQPQGNQAANGSWDLEGGLVVGNPPSPTTSIISAYFVVPHQANGTLFYVTNGNTASGVDLNVIGTLVSGTSGNFPSTGITLDGGGTVAFANTNNYGGATTINAGILRLNNSNAVQNSTVTLIIDNCLQFGANIGSFVFGGLAGTSSLALTDMNNQPVTVQVGQNSSSTSYSGVLTGSGGLVKLGTGTLSLNGTNLYTGSTTISNGVLQLIEPAALGTTPSISLLTSTATLDPSLRADGTETVALNQTLSGIGSVVGAVTNFGTVSPGIGSATGVLTVFGNVSLQGKTAMKIDKAGGSNDLLNSFGTIAYGGTLVITSLNTPLAVNDSFQLFSASGGFTGAFSAIIPSAPGSGMSWDTNSLAVDGTLKVVVGPITGPSTNANITSVSLSGTNLLVHGTNNNVPNTSFRYVVLTSTNIATPLSNWTPVITNTFNGNGTFDYTNPIVPGTPRQFIDVQAVP